MSMIEKPAGSDAMARFPSESYTTDDQGNRVLIGLTQEETAELERLVRDWWNDHTRKDGARSYGSIRNGRLRWSAESF
jgi:hypothetical protein